MRPHAWDANRSIAGIGSVDGDGTNLSRACLVDNLAELEVVPNPDQREVGDWSEEESGDEPDDGVDWAAAIRSSYGRSD